VDSLHRRVLPLTRVQVQTHGLPSVTHRRLTLCQHIKKIPDWAAGRIGAPGRARAHRHGAMLRATATTRTETSAVMSDAPPATGANALALLLDVTTFLPRSSSMAASRVPRLQVTTLR
jgi:hypothetical protein